MTRFWSLSPPLTCAARLLCPHFFSSSLLFPYFSTFTHRRLHVELEMAPHASFDTDQIKDKARKDLLYLLEGVSKDSQWLADLCKASTDPLACRCEERKIWSLRSLWLVQSVYSSNSLPFRITESIRYSSWRMAMQMSASEMWFSLLAERVLSTHNP